MNQLLYILVLVLFVSINLNAKAYKVAIFDYDISTNKNQSAANNIQKKLIESKLKFSEIKQYSGFKSEKKSLKVLRDIENKKYDLLITITSDSIQVARQRIINTPWLFTNVSNPKFFGINDINKPGKNRSGVTCHVPIVKQLTMFKKLMNDRLKKIGIIFDYSAKNRKAELAEFREACVKLGIRYDIRLVRHQGELNPIVNEMASNVDAIIVTSSDKIYNNIEQILQLSTKKKLPIFSVNKKGVSKGAIVAIAGNSCEKVNENLMPMVVDVLKNKKNPGDIPIQYQKNPLIYLNLTQAKKINLRISDEIKKRASKTY